MSRLRGLLVLGLVVAVVAGFLAIIVLPAFLLKPGPRGMLVYEQLVVFALIAWQSWSVARRERRAVDRNSLLLLGGLAASVVGQLLMASYLTRVVDLALGYAGLAIICLGFGLVVGLVRRQTPGGETARASGAYGQVDARASITFAVLTSRISRTSS